MQPPDPPPHLRLRVPGSSSNLGPGFDLLGLALSIFLEVEARPLEDAVAHRVSRLGKLGDELGDPAKDLTLRAFEAVTERHPLGTYYHFTQSSEIPCARGLGSSGAAIAAGLLLANAALGGTLSMQELMSIGIELEGHPDNVVASLLGGVTLCQALGAANEPLLIQPALHPSIGICVAWPGLQLSTQQSRAVLPGEVPFADAVSNPARLAFLLEGLRTGSPEQLRGGAEDRLHVPYRLGLIPGAAQALEAAYASGAWLATISGSGSTLIALGPKPELGSIMQAMGDALGAEHTEVQTRALEVFLGTPQVELL